MPATISPHSKYPHIPVGMIMDGGEYFGMLIPTMKHDNLNGYERILIVDHKSQRKIAPSGTTQQLTYRPRKGETRRGIHSQKKKKEEKYVLRKSSYNTQRKIVNTSPLVFPILGFHVKNFWLRLHAN